MGKVKQPVKNVTKLAGKESKILQKKISKKKTIKTNNLVPVLKKMGAKVLLNDSGPKPTFQKETDEKPFKSLLSRPKTDLFDENQIQSGVSALFKLVEKTSGKEPALFEDGESIFLQIACIKVPKTPLRQIHMNLSHSILKSDTEICLIVQDREDPKDYDNTIEYYENLLKKHGIINVKNIMPYHQFNNEYGKQFELKRKFASLYDVFLVDGAVHGYVVNRLGKLFYAKRKMPMAVTMKASNLKGHIEKLLCKSLLRVHSNSDCYSIEVGNTKMTPEQVFENVMAISEALNDKFPGGSDNVRRLGVKTGHSMTIPLYLSLKRNKLVNVPVIKPKRPKGFKAVKGELTTFSDRVVTVLPSGDIIVKDKKSKRPREDEDNEELEFNDQQSESEDEEKPKTLLKKVKQDKKKVKKESDLKAEEEGEDSNLEEAEESYLNFYKQEQVKMEKEQKENKKKIPKNKKLVEESEDDLNLEDSDGSDFDEGEHPNFDESEESDQEEITNFRQKKAGNNKKVKQETNNKKGNKNAKGNKTNGSAKIENTQFRGKKGKVELKKENKMEVVPIQVKGGNKKRKQEVLDTKEEISVEKASGEKNKKLNKKQKEAVAPSGIENGVVPKQKKIEPVAKRDKQNDNAPLKQNKKKIDLKEIVVEPPTKKAKKEIENKFPKQQKAVLTNQNDNASLKQNKNKIALTEIVVKAPTKKAKKEVENKFPKQQKVDKKSKKPNLLAKKAK